MAISLWRGTASGRGLRNPTRDTGRPRQEDVESAGRVEARAAALRSRGGSDLYETDRGRGSVL